MIRAIDLFCGVGGLTRGLEKSGIDVMFGVDIDSSCRYPYEVNNRASFIFKSIEKIKDDKIFKINRENDHLLLAGCAPCQPFSSYRKGVKSSSDKRWKLLREFKRLVVELMPDFVTMENVPMLREEKVFKEFTNSLKLMKYHISYSVVNCADYGVAQYRNRLVLMASRLGEIELVRPTHKPDKYVTVRKVIKSLPKIKAGHFNKKDKLHRSSSLSELNMKRIRTSRPGGTWRDWDDDLIANCHKKETGRTYPSVYGRMAWDSPAPTITTQFFGFGNGRFGHPEQDRAISIREGALLQGFPRGYKFLSKKEEFNCKKLGRLIGNAVPVRLGEIIGKSFIWHLNSHVGHGEA